MRLAWATRKLRKSFSLFRMRGLLKMSVFKGVETLDRDQGEQKKQERVPEEVLALG